MCCWWVPGLWNHLWNIETMTKLRSFYINFKCILVWSCFDSNFPESCFHDQYYNDKPSLLQIMAWSWTGELNQCQSTLPTHICVTWPQWVSSMPYCKKHSGICDDVQSLNPFSFLKTKYLSVGQYSYGDYIIKYVLLQELSCFCGRRICDVAGVI